MDPKSPFLTTPIEIAGENLDLCVAYHSGNGEGFPDGGSVYQDMESDGGIAVCDLDSFVGTRQSTPENFLPCGHWTEKGNAVVSKALLSFITQRFPEQSGSEE